MCELAESSPRISFRAKGDPPEQYLVSLDCVGLEPPDWRGGEPQRRTKHVVEFSLHASYPMVAPRLRPRTPIFHPNFLFGNDRLSIHHRREELDAAGDLADLVLRIGNLISFRSYDADDPLDPEAADWAEANNHFFPLDDRPWFSQVRELVSVIDDDVGGDAEAIGSTEPPSDDDDRGIQVILLE